MNELTLKEQTFCHLGNSNLLLIETVRNPVKLSRVYNKPDGGLWACVYTPSNTYRSEWEAWCEMDDFKHYDPDNYFIFRLAESAKILVINSVEDYENIDSMYKNENGTLNWDILPNFYDGVYVGRSHGYWVCNCNFDHPAFSLEGWDVKSVVIFRNSAIIPV